MSTTAQSPVLPTATIDALKRAGMVNPLSDLTPEQLERAENPPAGLRGKALAIYITEGKSGTEQTHEANEQRAKAKAESKTKANGSGELREGSTMSAIVTVLKAARNPLTAAEVLKRIRDKGLAPGLKGKTPQQTIAARMAVAARDGKHGITKPEPGRYTIKGGK